MSSCQPKSSALVVDLVTWKEPISSGVLFLSITLYAVLSAIVTYPLQWIFFILVWAGFSAGLVAKYVFKAKHVQWFNAERAASVTLNEMKIIRGAMSRVLSWEDPELSLTTVMVLFTVSVIVKYIGVPGTLSLAMIMPLLWRNLIQPSNHAIVEAMYALTKEYMDVVYQYLPDVRKAVNWEEPKASIAALVAINAMVCIAPIIVSDGGVATIIQCVAYAAVASFVLKEVAESSISCGSCMIDESSVEQVFKNSQTILDQVQAILMWQDVNISAWVFATCIGVMLSIHVLGSLPVALMVVNGVSIASHPKLMRLKQE